MAKLFGFEITRSKKEKEAPKSFVPPTGTTDEGAITVQSSGFFGQYLNLENTAKSDSCLLYTSPSPRDRQKSRMPSSA